MYVRVRVYVCVLMYDVFIYVCMYVCVCMYVRVCVYVCTYVSMHARMYILSMYVCVYTSFAQSSIKNVYTLTPRGCHRPSQIHKLLMRDYPQIDGLEAVTEGTRQNYVFMFTVRHTSHDILAKELTSIERERA
jgi:hypothetical protein